ncbi:ABC transporter substrate-binding protein [Cohnella thailandensis]|uniref:Sugar ABC transporter substrate-binding protein n=1 Tax=Cohnella thailandensis TaxID=557557 RepID=A0A841T5Y4_9BACL|nr:sugar ABC transporter substrate-binding protein [Cohnella thailandensis]MBB6637718.1 sugar ABC transporter substrate-binding protein [Cohnella thailandensis]MBP1974105.1 ABC-type glycerol-3-phosphate transport system substrate-binding protein [Cohnella thailandensis]
MAQRSARKWTMAVAAGLLGATALTGCSNGSSDSNSSANGASGTEKIKLSFETSVYAEAPHKKAIDALIQKYNEANPNVEITVHGTDYENFWDKLTTEIIAGTQGDIVQVYPENIATYNALQGDQGAFVNLDDKIKGTDLETGLVGQDLSKVNGSYYALSSYAWGSTGIFYRKSLFQQAGIDPASIRTLDDFKAAAIKLGMDTNGDGTMDQYGFSSVVGSHPFVSSEWYRLVARPVSGGVFFGDGEAGPYTADRINVNSPANVWAAEWWQDLMENPQATPPGTRDKKVSREMFWNGQAAMVMDGPWFIGMTKERDESLMDDLGLIAQPSVVYEGQTYQPNPHNYPLVSMISKNSKHQEEAWKFIEWMASPEAQEIISGSGMIPSSKAYAGTEAYAQENPLAAQFFDFQNNAYAPAVMDPPIAELGTLNQILINAAQDMFVAKQDAQTVLDKAADEMKKAMN